jgi:WD40 repeat protein
VTGTGKADAGDSTIAVTGLSNSVPGPGASVHVTHTGPANADHGGIAITGYVAKLTVVQPPVTEQQPPQAPQIPSWAVPRPDELEQVIRAVCTDPGGLVGITTGLEGAGGFGKTMLAMMACADERVREYFEGRVYVVTIGRDVRGPAALTSKVVSAIRFITGHTVPYTDPGMAGDELGRLLDQHPGRRTLLVLDDVWDSDQLDPFLRGGRDSVRLVTTRVPAALPDGTTRVRVDQMTQDQARAVLGQDLPPLPERLANELITVTGRWPLLLSLVNGWMRHQVKTGEGIDTVAADMLALLREEGPAAVDDSHPPPDLDDPAQRSRMVRATVQASMERRPADEQQRLAELGIFAEDEPIPILVATRLWKATGGLSRPRSRGLCYELSNLSLLTIDSDGGGSLVLHDVIRDYLRHELGSGRIIALNATLVDEIQDDLPEAEPLTASAPCPNAAWWTLAQNSGNSRADSYLADHAISHLLNACRTGQAEAVACDLRWVEARLHQRGPAAPWSDCIRIPNESATRRARDLAQAAHLLAPTFPAHALTAVLYSRLGPLPTWADQVTARQSQFAYPALRNHWVPPDLPHPALVRVLVGHPSEHVINIMISPDGSWLATAGQEGTVRIWNPATGTETATLVHIDVPEVAISPDGSWLATAGADGTVRIWDPATGVQTATLTGHTGRVYAVATAISPDRTWLATASEDKTVRIWNPATGTQTIIHAGHPAYIDLPEMAMSPDGTWLATARKGTMWIWDPATGAQITTFSDHHHFTAMAIAREGAWLATATNGDTVQIWDPATGTRIASLADVEAIRLAISPDGAWLATTSNAGRAQIWDLPADGPQTATRTGHASRVNDLAISPDGTWFAAISRGTVGIWDAATGTQTATLTGHAGQVTAVAISPDSTWLATGDDNRAGRVRIWDPATGTQTAAFITSLNGGVTAVAISADGTWLATASEDKTVRIWDPATGTRIASLADVEAIRLAISPDGTWLAAISRGTVGIWDAATGTQTATLTGQVTAVAISPDGTWLASTGRDGTVRIWDLVTGAETATLAGHGGEVTAVAISPDGTWLASTGRDGTVRIWDQASRQAVTIMRIDRTPLACAWTPDGAGLLVGGVGGVYSYQFHSPDPRT